MWQDLVAEMSKHRCPQCGQIGTMGIMMTQYRVVCQMCGAQNLDPFATGPWDDKQRLLDTVEGEPVYYYAVDQREVDPLDPDPNWVEFYRFLFGESSKRVIKGG